MSHYLHVAMTMEMNLILQIQGSAEYHLSIVKLLIPMIQIMDGFLTTQISNLIQME